LDAAARLPVALRADEVALRVVVDVEAREVVDATVRVLGYALVRVRVGEDTRDAMPRMLPTYWAGRIIPR